MHGVEEEAKEHVDKRRLRPALKSIGLGGFPRPSPYACFADARAWGGSQGPCRSAGAYAGCESERLYRNFAPESGRVHWSSFCERPDSHYYKLHARRNELSCRRNCDRWSRQGSQIGCLWTPAATICPAKSPGCCRFWWSLNSKWYCRLPRLRLGTPITILHRRLMTARFFPTPDRLEF